MAAFHALVKDGHGLVGRTDLDLLEKGLVVVAIGADSHCPINVLPCCSTSQNIVDHFSGWKGLFCDHVGNGAAVRTGRTKEVPIGGTFGSLFRVSNLK